MNNLESLKYGTCPPLGYSNYEVTKSSVVQENWEKTLSTIYHLLNTVCYE